MSLKQQQQQLLNQPIQQSSKVKETPSEKKKKFCVWINFWLLTKITSSTTTRKRNLVPKKTLMKIRNLIKITIYFF